jgi:hypothetical protein
MRIAHDRQDAQLIAQGSARGRIEVIVQWDVLALCDTESKNSNSIQGAHALHVFCGA